MHARASRTHGGRPPSGKPARRLLPSRLRGPASEPAAGGGVGCSELDGAGVGAGLEGRRLALGVDHLDLALEDDACLQHHLFVYMFVCRVLRDGSVSSELIA